jgi:hypothetical protein
VAKGLNSRRWIKKKVKPNDPMQGMLKTGHQGGPREAVHAEIPFPSRILAGQKGNMQKKHNARRELAEASKFRT